MIYSMTENSLKQFLLWEKQQDRITMEKQKQENKFPASFLPYYGAIGGSVTFFFDLKTTEAYAQHAMTEDFFTFQLNEPPKLPKEYEEKFLAWKKDGATYQIMYTTTSIGAMYSVQNLENNEKLDLTNYDDF